MRIIDGCNIQVDCDSCAATFITGRSEDGEPDDILCTECREILADLRNELAREQERVWLETFLSFPFKALSAPANDYVAELDWSDAEFQAWQEWREHQDLMDAADQAAYYSPEWRDEQ